MTTKAPAKLSHEDFVVKAIEVLREDNKPSTKDGTISKGIHVVYSGFNAALRSYYGQDADPQTITAELEQKGIVSVHPCRGGAMLYLAADSPKNSALAKMGLA